MASNKGTARLVSRFSAQERAGFYRKAQGLFVSNIGLGTYLGGLDDATDLAYTEAIRTALRSGINFIDTSLNYRNQRSELAVGAALRGVERDEIVVCTKAGYMVPGAVPASEIAGGTHSMAPAFLADQLEHSLANLGLESVDVFYLHNPEFQLGHISAEEFYGRIREAFAWLEKTADTGKIRYYGTATWDGFRRRAGAPEGLSLERLVSIAKEIGGEMHRFRFIQLPFNFAMPEGFALLTDGKSVITRAFENNITVVASATLLQGRLARNLPDEICDKLPGLSSDAQRSIQFARSTPGITVALVGMSSAKHVDENAALSTIPPAPLEQYLSVYQQSR